MLIYQVVTAVYGSPIQYAATNGSQELIMLLLRQGASLLKLRSYATLGGNCALMGAVSAGRPSILRLFVEHGAQMAKAEGCLGNVLQTAATLGYGDTVAMIMELAPDIDVHVTGRIKLSPLCLATILSLSKNHDHQRYKGIMRMLASKGAKLTSEDQSYWAGTIDHRGCRNSRRKHGALFKHFPYPDCPKSHHLHNCVVASTLVRKL